MDLSSYLLGVATLPVLAAVFFAAVRLGGRIVVFAERRGHSVEIRLRASRPVSDYRLRNDIWWERSFGPVFVGGWYRQESRHREPEPIFITRWVGFGQTDGVSIAFFRKRHLGFAPAQPQPAFPPLQEVR